MNHFQGKKPLQHVIDARLRGRAAASEIHGAEIPGHISAAADASKESAILLLILWTLQLPWIVPIAAWLLWKTGRSALLGYSRLERLHRVIEEEKWEIEHHRPQEKEELKAIYAAKGLSGRLLDDVVEALMADDNRLLQVMLEDELGLNLESYEHPLKQAAGAFLGVVGAAFIFSFGVYFLPAWGAPASLALIITLSSGASAQIQKNHVLPAIVWNLGVAALVYSLMLCLL